MPAPAYGPGRKPAANMADPASPLSPSAGPEPSDRVERQARQTAIGIGLAAAIFVAWLVLHVWGVFFHPFSGVGLAAAPLLVALLTWLDVGLFIIAHDCMHGSLAPGRPGINRAIGRVALGLYAGFSFDKLLLKHHAHHRHSGTAADPDFDPSGPHRFWPWYGRFFREYFGCREFLILAVVPWVYVLVLGAPWPRLLMFWALPAILSSLQLFAFGTYLPHRHTAATFADRHNARSNEYGWVASLLTCFHFGYHHEHHLKPGVPWWRLPRTRLSR